MAKRKTKKILSTNAVVYGPEPKFIADEITDENYNSVIAPLLLWYGQYAGIESEKKRTATHKAWIKEWALQNGFKKKEFSIPTQGISTVASVARLALKEFPIKDDHVDFIKNKISEWKPTKNATGFDRVAHGKKLAAQRKLKEEQEFTQLYTAFDHAIDCVLEGQSPEYSVTLITPKQEKELTAYYSRCLEEIRQSEDYKGRKRLFNKLVAIHEKILEDIKHQAQKTRMLKKANRAKAKTKKPAISQVKKLQYMSVHSDYNMASVDPEKLVGAGTVYVFDTKKRFLKKFVSNSVDGIQVSGTTLKNCNGTQKTIRKPNEQLLGFDKLPITKAAKVYDGIRAVDKETTGRMNKDVILLRVF